MDKPLETIIKKTWNSCKNIAREVSLYGALGVLSLPVAINGCTKYGEKTNQEQIDSRPNIILIMADDLGWGDVGYNGNKVIKTPTLDRLSKRGIRFDRFYAAAPVCSPTRGSCLTGRHPYRYGITYAGRKHMPNEEITLAEILRSKEYRTGHFGKWHLGTMTKTEKDSKKGGRPENVKDYSPPQLNGFDACFSTEAKVPTWDPMKVRDLKFPEREHFNVIKNGEKTKHFGTHYWDENGKKITKNLEGDDSRVIMDRVIPFIEDAKNSDKPFLAAVWFHTPHVPVVAGPNYASKYEEEGRYGQNYAGCITAMDDQIKRLYERLEELGIEDNTMLWFCSDNGPEKKFPGSAGDYKGTKRSLYEGGVRVPGFLVWPNKIKKSRATKVPCVTSDYLPTILDAVGYDLKELSRPLDGVSLMPLIEGEMTERPEPIYFQSPWTSHSELPDQAAINDNQYKLYTPDNGKTFELYDIVNDPFETKNIASQFPGKVESMRQKLIQWQESCERSLNGDDYTPYFDYSKISD